MNIVTVAKKLHKPAYTSAPLARSVKVSPVLFSLGLRIEVHTKLFLGGGGAGVIFAQQRHYHRHDCGAAYLSFHNFVVLQNASLWLSLPGLPGLCA